VNSNIVLLQQDGAPSNTARNTISCTCRAKSHLYWASDVASKQSRLEPGRLCVLVALQQRVLRWLFETVEQLKQAIDKWSSLIAVSMNGDDVSEICCLAEWQIYWTSFKTTFQSWLYTAFLLQFMHICELYSVIDILCKLHIYTHAVLCGATYRSTVKSSKSYIGRLLISVKYYQIRSKHVKDTGKM